MRKNPQACRLLTRVAPWDGGIKPGRDRQGAACAGVREFRP